MINLIFPSGRSVERCKQDAKKLVKQSKSSNSPIQLSSALDIVAQRNGVNKPWDSALKSLTQMTSNYSNVKMAQTHLLGHALNLLVENKLIDLDSEQVLDDEYLECELLGKPSIINWSYISFGEIRLSVWWNFDKTKHPQHLQGGYKNKILLDDLPDDEARKYWGNSKAIYSTSNTVECYSLPEPLAKKQRYKDFVGVVCSTWIERAESKHLQTDDGTQVFGSYIRQADRKNLMSIPECKPKGFSLVGKFYL